MQRPEPSGAPLRADGDPETRPAGSPAPCERGRREQHAAEIERCGRGTCDLATAIQTVTTSQVFDTPHEGDSLEKRTRKFSGTLPATVARLSNDEPLTTRSARLAGTSRAGATGLEPATSGVTGRRSNQLSYAPWTGFSVWQEGLGSWIASRGPRSRGARRVPRGGRSPRRSARAARLRSRLRGARPSSPRLSER